MELHGIKVFANPLVMNRVFKVQRHPIRKRRRNWRVVPVMEPGCWMANGCFYMHPDLVAKLKDPKP